MRSHVSSPRSHAAPHGDAASRLLAAMFFTLSGVGCGEAGNLNTEFDIPEPTGKAVSALSAPWVADFGYNAGGWRVWRHPRMTADVNGDGKDDVVGFADDGVYVSLSTGYSLQPASRWIADFGYSAGGWLVDRNPRMMADVNGDGKDDVVGFANKGTYVAISTGSSFQPAIRWSLNWGYDQWSTFPRVVADVSGDGKADVIGFGYYDVVVSLSTGSEFDYQYSWQYEFTYYAGWNSNHPRMVADVNGDSRGDVVGFFDDGPWVAFGDYYWFSLDAYPLWSEEFGYNAGGWRVQRHPRTMGDVNGDGKQDVIGFSDDGPYVGLSTGDSFEPSTLWANEFGYNAGGWRVEYHPRVMGDINGDGKQDVVGFANDGTYVALSTGWSFSP